MSTLVKMRQRQIDLVAESKDLFATIEREKRPLTDKEKERDDEIEAELLTLKGDIERAERNAERAKLLPEVPDPNAETGRVAAEPKKESEKFTSFGEQLQAIASSARPGVTSESWDRRLVNIYTPPSAVGAGPTGSNSSTPSEGGFLVQTDYSTALLERAHEGGEILSRVTRLPVSTNSNGMVIPGVDENSRANGQRWGGVRVYWADEADTVTATKPKFRRIELKLKKLMGLWYVTEEMLEDAATLEAVGNKAFSEEIQFSTELAIMSGTGSGQMLGFQNSGAAIVINPVSAQANDTIVTANILSMWARMPFRSRKRAIWYVNQDAEPQLWNLTIGSGTAVKLLYTPPGVDGNNTPYGLLLGRPVIPVEQAATLGTPGDIQLCDPSEYIMADKRGLQTASSMHVRFVNDEQVFRFTYRLDGQPAWNQPLTPFNGTNTQSPFILLGAR